MALHTGTLIAASAVAAGGVVGLTPVAARVLSRRGVVDRPNARSSHERPTVRGAGLVTGPVLAVALAIGGTRLTLSLVVVVLLATMLGGAEDLRGTGVAMRLIAQVAIAAAFLVTTSHIGTSLTLPVAAAALAFIVAYTNAFNFMDGINGISSVSAATAGVALIAMGHMRNMPDLELVGAVLSVVSLCFLPFNFPRARVFLGDSGSYSFGALIACATVATWRSGARIETVLAPLAIYLADTGTVVARRAARRERVAAPHREHVYQRLVQLGATHTQSTAVVLLSSAATTGLGLAAADAATPVRVASDAAMLVIVVLYLALPALVGARRRSAPTGAG
jgi:UDP-N-acetylmuramyl pentapeptide phosphotransferase/UDP-N-acetylglucosamine-1-phosphate transferase